MWAGGQAEAHLIFGHRFPVVPRHGPVQENTCQSLGTEQVEVKNNIMNDDVGIEHVAHT